MMDIQKYFSEVFVARFANQKHHQDRENIVNAQLICMTVVLDVNSKNVC